jgi:hypothetical protein
VAGDDGALVAQMLVARALASIESNEQSALIRKPEALFKLSLALMALSLIGSLPVSMLG